MINEKLSICIPTYNRSNYLKRAIESCLLTNHQTIKIYIQDNASPDDTVQVVKEFNDSRISYVRNTENIGGALNTERLIARCAGEYILFITDDDYLLPGAIDILLKFIEKSEVDFFTSDTIVFLEKTKRVWFYSYFEETGIFPIDNYEDIAKVFLSSHLWTRCCFKKSVYDDNFREKLGKNAYALSGVAMMAIANKKNLGYIAEPLTLHTWENDLYWEKDVALDNRDVLLQNEFANIILCGKEFISNQLFETIAIKRMEQSNYLHDKLTMHISSSKLDQLRKKLEHNQKSKK